MKKVAILICIVLLIGCAAGRTTHFEGESQYHSKFNKDSKLLFAVADQRPYVLSNDKAPSFTGLQRSLYGIPYSMHTKTGDPLAKELSMLFSRSMGKNGLETSSIYIENMENAQASIKHAIDEDRYAILFVMNEWKHDVGGTGNGRFLYDIKVDVFNSELEILATESKTGSLNINKNYLLGSAYEDVVEEMLNKDSILAAVNSNTSQKPVAMDDEKEDAAKSSCSVDQILNMQSSGLTKKQIAAACNPS